jgi:pectate lyase
MLGLMKIYLGFAVLMCVIASTSLAAEPLPAFPGAEGFGAVATGGRGKLVVEVTSLEDSGQGSLRDALKDGDRTIVFRVSGTINLNSRIEITKPNITIAGQTAPGDGICLRGHQLMAKNTQNLIIRFIRSRPGDEAKIEQDALTIWNCQKVIVDHCSLSWSTDSVCDVVKGSREATIQWSIISEPLNNSVHVKGAHGYGTGWGYGSFHHNLLAHCESRAPRLGADVTRGMTDFRNNVVYNWGSGWSYGGEHSDIDFVGNYFRPGPSSKHGNVLFSAWLSDTRIFLSGNVMDGNIDVTNDNLKGLISQGSIHPGKIDLQFVPVPSSFGGPAITTDDAKVACEKVLNCAGASLPRRDAVDERVVNDVIHRTGSIIDSQASVGGWPELKSAPAPSDKDKDGMPDEWEQQHGLNPDDASDGAKESQPGEYTNLEIYLNQLAAPAMGDRGGR